MAGKVRHLVERGGRYWARVVVPKDVVIALGVTDLREPLGGERAVALRKLPAAVARLHGLIDAARSSVQNDLRASPAARPNRALTPRQVALTHYAEELEIDDASRVVADPATLGDPTLFRPRNVEALKRIAAGRADVEEAEAVIGWAVAKFVERGNVEAAPGSPQWRELARMLAGIQLEGVERSTERDDGDDSGEPKHRMLKPEVKIVSATDPLAARIVGPDSHKTLAELVDRVIAEKKPKPGTANEYRVAARMLAEHLVAPRAVYTITRLDVLSFKGALQKLPSNYTKRFAGLPIPEAIKANAARATPFDTLDGATTNKWLSRINTLLTWAMNNGVIPAEHNPAAGVKVDQGKKSSPPRIPFAPGDLAKIFAAPLFSSETPLGEEHWTLLVGLHTGLRASEIAQIQLDSIRRERGVLVFAIEEETKNEQSRRIVPVHSTLIAIGIEGRVESLRRAGATHLFPEWFEKAEARKATSTTANQTFANYIPRWFNRTHLPSLGITDPRKKFHSLRHSLKTALARAGVSREVSDAITGHDDDSSGAGYVHEQSIETMRDALEKVHFDGLDLSALMPAKAA